MPLAFPADPCAHGLDHQYMIGPWLLAAPIFNPEGRRSIYLPEGPWFDFWTGRRIDGPRAMDIKAPLARMPLFVRAGAILPTMKPALRIPEGRIDPLIVEVWPHPPVGPIHGRVLRERIPRPCLGPLPLPLTPVAASKFCFYEDEGRTDFRLSWDGRRAVLKWKGKRGKDSVRVRFKS
jgi:hypothetical protein